MQHLTSTEDEGGKCHCSQAYTGNVENGISRKYHVIFQGVGIQLYFPLSSATATPLLLIERSSKPIFPNHSTLKNTQCYKKQDTPL
jgi:hypothetical protein